MRTLSLTDARRLAVMGQLLGGARPASVLEVVEGIGRVQVDPTTIVERAERLTVWSRLGAYDHEELRSLLEDEPRRLFEYVSFLLPVADLALHRPAMDRYPPPTDSRGRYVGEWLRDNAAFRHYVLEEIRSRGPLRSRDLDDRADVPWQTGGWNDGKNLGRMLEILWRAGELAVARREGAERVWDLFERVLPGEIEELPDEVVALEKTERRLRTYGLAPGGDRPQDWGYEPGLGLALESLRSDGVAVPVAVDGLPGEWLAHRDLLNALDAGSWEPRTTLLGPFDPLIARRERTLALFGFSYRFELYLPAAKREYGPYTLVLLDGERLTGRVVAAVDRRAKVLRVERVVPEPDAPEAEAWAWEALHDLSAWLGVEVAPADR